MTDRELLELAAKAACVGLPEKDDNDEVGRQYDPHLGLWVMWDYGQWDWFRPHLDDGQALRLAVKLKMGDLLELVEEEVGFSKYRKDPYDATRLAIVRAAAEIGRTL